MMRSWAAALLGLAIPLAVLARSGEEGEERSAALSGTVTDLVSQTGIPAVRVQAIVNRWRVSEGTDPRAPGVSVRTLEGLSPPDTLATYTDASGRYAFDSLDAVPTLVVEFEKLGYVNRPERRVLRVDDGPNVLDVELVVENPDEAYLSAFAPALDRLSRADSMSRPDVWMRVLRYSLPEETRSGILESLASRWGSEAVAELSELAPLQFDEGRLVAFSSSGPDIWLFPRSVAR